MNIFAIYFYKIFAKYSPKRTKLHHFLKIFSGEHAPCMHHANTSTFPKIFRTLHPPPPNEILDTPLFICIQFTVVCHIIPWFFRENY